SSIDSNVRCPVSRRSSIASRPRTIERATAIPSDIGRGVRHRGGALCTVCSGVRMSSSRHCLAWISSALSALVVAINLTVMSVAFDSLRHDFPGTELSVMGWVLSVYTIVFGALLVPAGRLADYLGRRTIFLWGLGIMSVSSTLAGLAPSVWVIIVGRVGQGAAAACLVPSTLGLLLEAVPTEQRVNVTAFYSVLASVGGIAGPTVGALLIRQFSWRAAFFIAPV